MPESLAIPASPRFEALDELRLVRDRRLGAGTLLLIALPTAWALWGDLHLEGDDPDRLFLRIIVRALLVALLVLGALLLGQTSSRGRYEQLFLIVTVGTAIAMVALNALRPVGASMAVYTPITWLMVYYGGFVATLWRQLAAPILLSVGLIAVRFLGSSIATSGNFSNDLLALFTVNAIGLLFAIHRTDLNRRETEHWVAQREAREALERVVAELKVLRGIIPICAYCRQVRTEVGDWEGLEAYVRTRSEAQFSHGMCPSCEAERFPDIAEPGPDSPTPR